MVKKCAPYPAILRTSCSTWQWEGPAGIMLRSRRESMNSETLVIFCWLRQGMKKVIPARPHTGSHVTA